MSRCNTIGSMVTTALSPCIQIDIQTIPFPFIRPIGRRGTRMTDTSFQAVFLSVQRTPGIAITISTIQRETGSEIGTKVHLNPFQCRIIQIYIQLTGFYSFLFITRFQIHFFSRNQIINFIDVSVYRHIETLSGIFYIGRVIITRFGIKIRITAT